MDGWTDQKIIETERINMQSKQTPAPQQRKKVSQVEKTKSTNNVRQNQSYKKPTAKAKAGVEAFSQNHEITKRTKKYLQQTYVNKYPIQQTAFSSLSTAPTRASTQIEIPICATGYGGVIFTPNPKTPIRMLKLNETPTTWTNPSPGINAIVPFSRNGLAENTVYALGSFAMTSSTTSEVLNPTVIKSTRGIQIVTSREYVDPSKEAYGEMLYSGLINHIGYTLNSPVNQTVTIGGFFQPVAGHSWIPLNGVVLNLVANVPFTQTTAIGNGNGTYSFTIEGTFGANSSVQLVSAFSIEMENNYFWSDVGFIGTQYNTQVLDLWLSTATQIRTSACDLLLSNFNPDLYKNGTISGAEISATSLANIAPDPIAIMAWIATAPTPQHRVNMPLSEGAHVSWMPQTMKDLKMKSPADLDSKDPYNKNFQGGWILVWKSLDDPELLQPLKAELNMALEATTGQQIIPMTPAPHINDLMDEWLLFNAGFLRISENPKHLQRAATAVSQFMQQPKVKQTIKYLGEGAKVAIPLFLAAL